MPRLGLAATSLPGASPRCRYALAMPLSDALTTPPNACSSTRRATSRKASCSTRRSSESASARSTARSSASPTSRSSTRTPRTDNSRASSSTSTSSSPPRRRRSGHRRLPEASCVPSPCRRRRRTWRPRGRAPHLAEGPHHRGRLHGTGVLVPRLRTDASCLIYVATVTFEEILDVRVTSEDRRAGA